MRLIINKISKEKFKYDKNIIDNESFDDIENDFKLILYASYYNEESSTMDKMLKDASDLSLRYNLNIFEYNVKFEKEIKIEESENQNNNIEINDIDNDSNSNDNENNNNWNAYNFRKNYGKKNQGIKKILISGTIGFMEVMQNEFKKSEICAEESIICI
jgi:hypothetical protein